MASVLDCLTLKDKALEFLEPPGTTYPETQCNSSEATPLSETDLTDVPKFGMGGFPKMSHCITVLVKVR
jgi:hypothetical protein